MKEPIKKEEKQDKKEPPEITFPHLISVPGGIHHIYTKDKGMYIFISPGNPSLEELEEIADFLAAVVKKSIQQRDQVEKEKFKKIDEKKKEIKVPIETK